MSGVRIHSGKLKIKQMDIIDDIFPFKVVGPFPDDFLKALGYVPWSPVPPIKMKDIKPIMLNSERGKFKFAIPCK